MSLKEVLKQLGIKFIGWVKSNCVNNLLSDRADLPLAAAQGKVIDEKITALNSNIDLLKGAVTYKHTTNVGDTLVKLYDSQPNGSCRMQFCQNAGDNPADGLMDICISVRVNGNWGFQYVFASTGVITVRSRNNSDFGAWKQLL